MAENNALFGAMTCGSRCSPKVRPGNNALFRTMGYNIT